MNWLSRLKRRATSAAVDREHDSFVRGEWHEYFGRLTAQELQAASVRLCRKVLATVPIAGEEVERAMEALSSNYVSPELVSATRSIVERIESEYDALVGDDVDKLSCTDPRVDEAFVRARAATTLLNALEGNHKGMAYEAWFVLDDLDEVRSLVGLPACDR